MVSKSDEIKCMFFIFQDDISSKMSEYKISFDKRYTQYYKKYIQEATHRTGWFKFKCSNYCVLYQNVYHFILFSE